MRALPSIAGIGVDITNVTRIGRLFSRFGERFLERAFHAREAARARALPAPQQHEFLASRWAAKEALHKALRTRRLLFPEIEVVRGPSGAPAFELHGAAAAHARGADVHVSLSHEADYAIAFVVVTEARAAV